MKKLTDQLIKLAKDLEIPLILRISLDGKKSDWTPSRQAKKQQAKFLEFAQQFEEYITSGTRIDSIRETINLLALVYTGNFFLGTGNMRKAKEFYEKVIFLDRQIEAAWNNLGVLLHITRDHIRALNCFEKTYELNVTVTAARFNQGYVLFDLGREEDAIEYFQKVLELEPENTPCWFLFGMAYFKIGDFQAAIKPFQLAVQQRPNYVEALEPLAIAFQNIGELGKSLEALEQIFKVNENRADILAQMGAIYLKLGLRSQGFSSYTQAADLYEEKGQHTEAQTCRDQVKKAMRN